MSDIDDPSSPMSPEFRMQLKIEREKKRRRKQEKA